MPPKYTLTTDDRRKGGWSRARQKANWRRDHPTELEAQIRNACKRLGYIMHPEYEIWNDFGPYPQWFDIYLPEKKVAIEIDGSHAWHDRRYGTSKMYNYDTAKIAFCWKNGVHLLVIHEWFYSDAELQEIIEKAAQGIGTVKPEPARVPVTEF